MPAKLRLAESVNSTLALPCDVTDPQAQAKAFDRAIESFGSLDVVFANAGLGATAKRATVPSHRGARVDVGTLVAPFLAA